MKTLLLLCFLLLGGCTVVSTKTTVESDIPGFAGAVAKAVVEATPQPTCGEGQTGTVASHASIKANGKKPPVEKFSTQASCAKAKK